MISSQISRYICNISLNYHPLSSLLLLRISPNFFNYFGSSPMCLSSLNRSISKAFRHIMPYSAPLCKVLHYSKTGVPWQTNKILIFFFFLLFSGSSILFTFFYFFLFLVFFGISLHIFVINFVKKFVKFQVCIKGKSLFWN